MFGIFPSKSKLIDIQGEFKKSNTQNNPKFQLLNQVQAILHQEYQYFQLPYHYHS